MDIEQIASICHASNRALCETQGDTSQPQWKYAPGWQRDSTFESIRFTLENPEAPISASHDAWSAEKTAAGWVYGPVKDADAKTHPCLVPYDDLPAEQQAKDYLFKAVVTSLSRFLV